MGYLLSVVIPTRNRQYYALETVKQIAAVLDERVQIIVSDNSDDRSLQAQLEALGLHNLKYQFIAERIPGVDNYANGIAMCDGEYVCCIGDDDGVVWGITEVVQWASEQGIPAIKPGVQAAYIWPNVTPAHITGCLSLGETSVHYHYAEVKPELARFLHTGCDDLPSAQLPKAYHGIIRKDLFDQIREKTGRYCGGLSPDIYLSISLSLLMDRVLCLDVPLTIFGACKQSTTGDSLNKTNKGRLEDAPHFVGQPYEWSDKVPRFYCGSNIWADSALHALADMEAWDMMAEFSVEKLTCTGLLEQRAFTKELKENFRKNNGDKALLRRMLIRAWPRHFLKTCKNGIKQNKFIFDTYKRLRGIYRDQIHADTYSIQDVADITQAEQIVTDTIGAKIAELVALLRKSGK